MTRKGLKNRLTTLFVWVVIGFVIYLLKLMGA